MGSREQVLYLGTACPLCGEPTAVWVGDAVAEIAENVRSGFPRWTPEMGACARCIESYMPRRLN